MPHRHIRRVTGRMRNLCILVIIFLAPFSDQASCVQESTCSCSLDGSLIDLTSLAQIDGNPKFVDIPDSNDVYRYSWNPCYPFTEGTCLHVAVCQTMASADAVSIGYPETAEFVDLGGKITIRYTAVVGENLRETFVSLVCDFVEHDFTFDANNSTQHFFTLRTRYACLDKHGLSIGTILVIALASTAAAYLIGGVVYQSVVLKTTGRERLPNVEFWTSLPGLVKDGYVFVTNCLLSSYHQVPLEEYQTN